MDNKEWFKSLADQLRQILTTPTDTGVGWFRKKGYRHLYIVVLDTEGGELITHLQTYRKQEDIQQLVEDLTDLAIPPDELLDQLDLDFAEPDGTIIKDTTAAKAIKKQIAGGRPRGVTKKTAAKYLRLAELYHNSDLPENNFAKQHKVSLRTLQRALDYHHKKVSGKGIDDHFLTENP